MDQALSLHNLAQLPGPAAASGALDQPGSHLDRYLLEAELGGIPDPAYYAALPARLHGKHRPNLLYPLGGGVYAHVYTRPEASAPRYRMVEPHQGVDLANLLPAVEQRMIELAGDLTALDLPGSDRAVVLTAIIAACCSTAPPEAHRQLKLSPPPPSWQKWLHILRALPQRLRQLGQPPPVPVTRAQLDALQYLFLRDKVGMGILQPFLQDPYLEDIGGRGVGPMHVVHKLFGSLATDTVFATTGEADRFAVDLAEKVGRSLTVREPILDAGLPDGSRINIVFGTAVSRHGSNFSVRRVARHPLSLIDLVDYGTITCELIAYLSLLIGEGLNVFVAGEAASGKTTLMNALTALFPPWSRIVSVEDTPELRLGHGNWIAEVTRPAREDHPGISLFELVKAALRQRPNAILIGEIRGEEGPVAFQAMQTGHVCLSTIHASNVENVVHRLVNFPIQVPRENMDNLHAVVVLNDVRLPSGRRGRRVVSVAENYGYDLSTGRCAFRELARWDPAADRLQFTSPSQHLLDRVAHRRGLAPDQSHEIAAEWQRRTGLFQRMQAAGVKNYNALLEELARTHHEGLLR